jgi:hypothetical protein
MKSRDLTHACWRGITASLMPVRVPCRETRPEISAQVSPFDPDTSAVSRKRQQRRGTVEFVTPHTTFAIKTYLPSATVVRAKTAINLNRSKLLHGFCRKEYGP